MISFTFSPKKKIKKKNDKFYLKKIDKRIPTLAFDIF